jgi:hypothetical protein
MGRNARGVHAMKLANGDEMIDMSVIGEGQKVLAITENGYGKLTDPDAYREQGRNGKGIIAMALNEKTGSMAAQLTVGEDEDILLMNDVGTIISMAAADIRETGAIAQVCDDAHRRRRADVPWAARVEEVEPTRRRWRRPSRLSPTASRNGLWGGKRDTAFDAGRRRATGGNARGRQGDLTATEQYKENGNAGIGHTAVPLLLPKRGFVFAQYRVFYPVHTSRVDAKLLCQGICPVLRFPVAAQAVNFRTRCEVARLSYASASLYS